MRSRVLYRDREPVSEGVLASVLLEAGEPIGRLFDDIDAVPIAENFFADPVLVRRHCNQFPSEQ
jgi:hypothetical protein